MIGRVAIGLVAFVALAAVAGFMFVRVVFKVDTDGNRIDER